MSVALPLPGDPDACQACRFWQQRSEQVGACRRHAPVLILLTTDEHKTTYGRFPRTRDVEWCGDFEPVAALEGPR